MYISFFEGRDKKKEEDEKIYMDFLLSLQKKYTCICFYYFMRTHHKVETNKSNYWSNIFFYLMRISLVVPVYYGFARGDRNLWQNLWSVRWTMKQKKNFLLFPWFLHFYNSIKRSDYKIEIFFSLPIFFFTFFRFTWNAFFQLSKLQYVSECLWNWKLFFWKNYSP